MTSSLDTVRSFYASLARGDVPAVLALLDPGIEWTEAERLRGGKDKLGSISKQGDRYLRSLFTAGALAVIRYAKIHGKNCLYTAISSERSASRQI